MDVTIIDVLKGMIWQIPAIIAATLLLTSTIKGIFQITNKTVNHIISWVVSIGTALGFVACNQMTFGLGGWDYAVAACCGIIVGLDANEIYSWDKIKQILTIITELFGGASYKVKKAEADRLYAEKKAARLKK